MGRIIEGGMLSKKFEALNGKKETNKTGKGINRTFI